MNNDDMTLPIELTQIIQQSNECLTLHSIKVDASKISGICDYGDCTLVIINENGNREEMKVAESVEQVCTKIGEEFYACDKIKLAQKILS